MFVVKATDPIVDVGSLGFMKEKAVGFLVKEVRMVTCNMIANVNPLYIIRVFGLGKGSM